MRNEMLFIRALGAAYEVGERVRISNGRLEWSEEEIDAAAYELRRRLLSDEQRAVGALDA